MTIPGFTAEASVGKVKESYFLTSEAPAESGMVLPQCMRIWTGRDFIWVGCFYKTGEEDAG
jgi:hypothetical protein